jgi:hypothetical protein
LKGILEGSKGFVHFGDSQIQKEEKEHDNGQENVVRLSDLHQGETEPSYSMLRRWLWVKEAWMVVVVVVMMMMVVVVVGGGNRHGGIPLTSSGYCRICIAFAGEVKY